MEPATLNRFDDERSRVSMTPYFNHHNVRGKSAPRGCRVLAKEVVHTVHA